MFLMQTLSENEFQRNKITFGAISREERQYFSVQSTSGLPSIFIASLAPVLSYPSTLTAGWFCCSSSLMSNKWINTLLSLLPVLEYIITDFTRSNGGWSTSNHFEQEQNLQTSHLLGRVKINFDWEQFFFLVISVFMMMLYPIGSLVLPSSKFTDVPTFFLSLSLPC